MSVTVDDLRDAMTKKEFAEYLKISLRSVDRMIKEGKVEVVHVGPGRGSPRITQRAATEYLTRSATKAIAADKTVSRRPRNTVAKPPGRRRNDSSQRGEDRRAS